jgi:hypothetical protein
MSKTIKSLFIKENINNSNIHKIILDDIYMFRDYILYIETYKNKYPKVVNNICFNIINNIELNDDKIKYIVNNHFLFDILKTKLSSLYLYNPSHDYNYRDKLIKILLKKINKKNINNFDYDVVIDGGNLIHRCKNINLFHLKLSYKKPLYIFCEKHKDKLKHFNYDNIIFTSPKIYDDYFILYYAIKNNVKIITKDKFKDIIYYFNNKINNKNTGVKNYIQSICEYN